MRHTQPWVATWMLLTLAIASLQPTHSQRPPNFLVILTDDQDYMLGSSSRKYMPNLHSLIGDQGMELRNFIVPMAWCCPSRASLLTGMLVHNTNITSSSLPRGGAGGFMQSSLADNYLPIWLQDLGYATYFTGKYLNQLRSTNLTDCPKGWTLFEGMLDGFNSSYLNWFTDSFYSNNCSGMQTYRNTYQTHIMRDKGMQYIDHALASDKPFFIELAPVAPHDQGAGKKAVPAPGDEWAFPGATMPKAPNWGVSLPKKMYLSDIKVSWKFSQDRWIRRIRSLKAVDEMVRVLVKKLTDTGRLSNTYIIYTSDNGFHLGNHNMEYEKFTPYEEDVRVPMFIRGPGIPAGIKTDYQAAMIDVAASILTLAGGSLLPHLDGVPIPFDSIMKGMAGPFIQVGVTPSPPPPCPDATTSSSSSDAASSMQPRSTTRFKLPPSRRLRQQEATSTTTTAAAAAPVPSNLGVFEPALPVPAPGLDPAPTTYPGDPDLLNLFTAASPPLPGPAPAVAQLEQPAGSGDTGGGSDSSGSDGGGGSGSDGGGSGSGAGPALGGPSLQEFSLELPDDEGSTGLEASTPWFNEHDANQTEVMPTPSPDFKLALRDTMMLEGWLDMNAPQLFRKNYRSVRTCTTWLLPGQNRSEAQFMGGYTCYKYTVWCIPNNRILPYDSVHLELYDLGADIYELNSLLPTNNTEVGRLQSRLNAVLTVMAYCRGPTCRLPWLVLHPDGSVANLADAMATQYDAMYAGFVMFGFNRCRVYYNPSEEIADANILSALTLANAVAASGYVGG